MMCFFNIHETQYSFDFGLGIIKHGEDSIETAPLWFVAVMKFITFELLIPKLIFLTIGMNMETAYCLKRKRIPQMICWELQRGN